MAQRSGGGLPDQRCVTPSPSHLQGATKSQRMEGVGGRKRRLVEEKEGEEESHTIELPDSDLVLVRQLVLERISHRTLVVRPHDGLQC